MGALDAEQHGCFVCEGTRKPLLCAQCFTVRNGFEERLARLKAQQQRSAEIQSALGRALAGKVHTSADTVCTVLRAWCCEVSEVVAAHWCGLCCVPCTGQAEGTWTGACAFPRKTAGPTHTQKPQEAKCAVRRRPAI